MGFLTVLHIIVALFLILLVLVQDSKGAMGSTFGGGGGGGSNSLLGASGAENILSKLTKGVVVIFAISCILLTRFSAQNKESVLDIEGSRATVPAEPVNPAPSTNSEEPSTSP